MEILNKYIKQIFEGDEVESSFETAKEQIYDWGRQNDFEIKDKKKNVLVVMVPPIEKKGKMIDVREPVTNKLIDDIVPLGFVYDSTRGGSMGRFVLPGVRGKYQQLEVYVKPTIQVSGGGSAAARGQEAEDNLVQNISQKFSQYGISVSSAGSGHGSDLTISAPGKEPMTIEIKNALRADFGQFSISYNIDKREWEPIKTPGFEKNKNLFGEIFNSSVAPYMNQNAQIERDDLENPSMKIKSGKASKLHPLIGTGDFKKRLQSKWFNGKTDMRLKFNFIKISNYYASKGDRFIQVNRGKGLYALNPYDAEKMNIPFFGELALSGMVRIRIKPHSGYDGNHSFVVAIKVNGTLPPSPLNLENDEDLDEVIKMFMGE